MLGVEGGGGNGKGMMARERVRGSFLKSLVCSSSTVWSLACEQRDPRERLKRMREVS